MRKGSDEKLLGQNQLKSLPGPWELEVFECQLLMPLGSVGSATSNMCILRCGLQSAMCEHMNPDL